MAKGGKFRRFTKGEQNNMLLITVSYSFAFLRELFFVNGH